jgi:hypothetical protein
MPCPPRPAPCPTARVLVRQSSVDAGNPSCGIRLSLTGRRRGGLLHRCLGRWPAPGAARSGRRQGVHPADRPLGRVSWTQRDPVIVLIVRALRAPSIGTRARTPNAARCGSRRTAAAPDPGNVDGRQQQVAAERLGPSHGSLDVVGPKVREPMSLRAPDRQPSGEVPRPADRGRSRGRVLPIGGRERSNGPGRLGSRNISEYCGTRRSLSRPNASRSAIRRPLSDSGRRDRPASEDPPRAA